MAYACDIDPFDALTDLEVQGYRMQPVWQVCAAVDDALATARLLNRAEGLRTV
jgi:hypothetical protein